MLICESCQSDDLRLVEKLEDERRRIACNSCDHEWIRGEARVPRMKVDTFAQAKKRFPGPEQVSPARLELVAVLKADFLRAHPDPQSDSASCNRTASSRS